VICVVAATTSIGARTPLRDEPLIAFELRARLFDGINLHLQISQRKNQIPVSLLDLRDGFNRALAKLRVGQTQIFLGDFDVAALVVETQTAPQRLRITQIKRARKLRIEQSVLVIVVVLPDVKSAA
jgi:hypothetical protein